MALMYDDPNQSKRRPAGAAIADPAASPAANTFNGAPIDLGAGARLNTVPTQPAVAPATPPARQPFEIANDAVGMVNNATTTAQGRINAANNPMSDDAETLRRLEISQGSFKGSPSARGAMAQAYLGQLGASREAVLAGINPTANIAGQAAAAENQRAAQGVEGQQRMALQELIGTQQSGIESMRQSGETARSTANNTAAIDVAKIGRNPVGAYQQAADGTLALVEGASARPVVGADGKPFAGKADTISAADRFKAYQERAKAIETAVMTPEQKQAQLTALQAAPEFASLFGAPGGTAAQGTPAAPQNAQQFISAARAQGSKMSDAELTAYYNQKYGTKSAP